ncbi:hypothetical protein TCSYLVIO_007280 [Trypanosoma cruzi]|uniref:Transmembrane protein 231 n=2 Tax=Trypanosoma cruzi TaxID=5693 RepID=V5DS46_TRYCR|nr:hypothetical protein TCSYLVIO_007280 [Trypanosoma cruzi]ESS70221.1 hypothetical protein TCDM_01025 [Trypanosoma cruzi Dm28c]PBJ80369.1 Transmembrane protein 231 [Trypanosoma cruzi cruzi]KAF8285364.1 putative Transmembrane protein 231 [Trypanosoma cruzi]PWU95397.1 putative Transmembrane protein 231 [Trypanosoma cruzi]
MLREFCFRNAAVFHEHYKVRYIPRGLGSWLFYILCLLAILVAPVFIGLSMRNFWLRSNSFMQMPHVYFTDRCVLRYTTVKGQERLWTCSNEFNEKHINVHEQLAVLPFFSIYEDDRDGDGRVDFVTMILSLPINDVGDIAKDVTPSDMGDAVFRVDFLPEFFYEFDHHIVTLKMRTAALFSFKRDHWIPGTEGGPLSAITEGDLLFHSTEPLIASPNVRYTRTYIDSPFDNVTDVDELLNVPLFASQYTLRNQSLQFKPKLETVGGLALLRDENYNRVLGEDLDALGAFTWRIKLHIQRAEVNYVPSIQEALKWAWVQYFCIAYVLQRLLWWLRGILVKTGVLGSTAFFHRGWKSS